MLTHSKMFKYVLIRGVNDIRFMFNNEKGPSLWVTRREIEEANAVAEPVWRDRQRARTTRMANCRRILSPVLMKVASHPVDPIIPKCVLRRLDATFEQSYGGGDKPLLIGRAEEDAYVAQASYTDSIVLGLSSYHQYTKTRVLTCIGKAFGFTSIPILSVAFVDAMWGACKSKFYRRQLEMVSQTCLRIGVLADLRLSCIGGSNRLRNRCMRRAWGVTIYHR